ncbi:MAG: hypothetical protein S4CHLAM7_12810 [Chlamydiae bacterium]|nr:hypothetical protein [Chlamydiota bacterium]
MQTLLISNTNYAAPTCASNKQNVETNSSASKTNDLTQNFWLEKKFSAGDSFPIDLQVKGEVFQLADSRVGSIKIIHDFFVKCSENDLLFSLDGESWSEFTELFSGEFGFSTDFSDTNAILKGVFEANLR